MDFPQFEAWLGKLSGPDRRYLEKHPAWKKAYGEVRRKGVLPKGFVENTMEILEGGSESET